LKTIGFAVVFQQFYILW